MKKNLIFAFCLCSLLASAQIQWTQNPPFYNDNNNYFSWRLPEELPWDRVPTQGKHVVFKAETYGMSVFVQIADSKYIDIWKEFETLSNVAKNSLKISDKYSGMVSTILSNSKCTFVGKHAIKTLSKHIYKDDVHKETTYRLIYKFFRNDKLWTVCAGCLDVVYNEIGEDGLKTLINGFNLNAFPL